LDIHPGGHCRAAGAEKNLWQEKGHDGERMNKKQIDLFSSKKTDNWQTPPKLLKELEKEFGKMFDPCPLRSRYNGLRIDWQEVNFINPPYSKVKEFLKKAHEEIEKGNAKTCVFLTFANTDTAWFHDYVLDKAEIRYIKGRLRFLNEDGEAENSAMRPSIICILRGANENPNR